MEHGQFVQVVQAQLCLSDFVSLVSCLILVELLRGRLRQAFSGPAL
jgi:hypothetical protein